MEWKNQNEGLRALTEAYKAYKDLLPEPPAGTWGAWIRLGQREKERMFNREESWRWNR